MKLLRWVVPLLLLPLLAGCINDGAAYVIDGPGHALSVVRVQNLFWENKVKLSAVVSRMPDCQRKHAIGKFPVKAAVELWEPGPGTYILKIGSRMFVTETRSCQGFAEMTEDPPGGMGNRVGVFSVKGSVFTFTADPKPEAEAAGAATGAAQK